MQDTLQAVYKQIFKILENIGNQIYIQYKLSFFEKNYKNLKN
jgi:hypothetical protein